MAKINSSDIAAKLADEMGLSRAAAKAYTDLIFKTVRESVERGDEVNISNFGKFKMKITAPRKGRNVHTGKTVDIAAKNKIVFDMSRKLMEIYNENAKEGSGDEIIDADDTD